MGGFAWRYRAKPTPHLDSRVDAASREENASKQTKGALVRIRSEPRLQRLPAAELATRRCTTRRAAGARTFVLVPEDEPAFFQVIRRHFDRHPIARQRL